MMREKQVKIFLTNYGN